MFTISDGVSPELAVLGFRRCPACTGQTGRRHWSDRPAQGFAGVDRFDDGPSVLAHSSVLAQFCVNITFTHQSLAHQWFLDVDEERSDPPARSTQQPSCLPSS